jgi:membrane protein implicated in regulation of membrane protease activity
MIWDLLVIFVVPPAASAVFLLVSAGPGWRRFSGFCLRWAAAAAADTVGLAVTGYGSWALASVASAGLALFLWWLSRRRRKRAPRMYGAKSRALVAALVRRVRETAVPRPGLRPVPEGSAS